MNYIFSRHALEQAKIRNIPEKIIKETVNDTDVIITVYKTSNLPYS